MSLEAVIGPEINLLGETPDHCHQLVMPQPILRNTELEKLRQVDHNVFEARTIDMTWPASAGRAGHGAAGSRRSAAEASELVERGVNIIVLSDRNIGAGARGDAVAARHGRGAPPPRPRGHPPPDRPRGRDRRGDARSTTWPA